MDLREDGIRSFRGERLGMGQYYCVGLFLRKVRSDLGLIEIK